jgi:DNA-binding NtrC family response regulator
VENKPRGITAEAVSLFMDYSWPGNVRQLQNFLQYAIVKSSGNYIRPEDLPMEIASLYPGKKRRGPMKKLNAELVRATLEKTGYNKAKAARVLGVGRATLYRFLNEHPDMLASENLES